MADCNRNTKVVKYNKKKYSARITHAAVAGFREDKKECLMGVFTSQVHSPEEANTRIEKPQRFSKTPHFLLSPVLEGLVLNLVWSRRGWGVGWPWSESCVNGGSTQHLVHHGLPRLKAKSLYLPLCFIKGLGVSRPQGTPACVYL